MLGEDELLHIAPRFTAQELEVYGYLADYYGHGTDIGYLVDESLQLIAGVDPQSPEIRLTDARIAEIAALEQAACDRADYRIDLYLSRESDFHIAMRNAGFDRGRDDDATQFFYYLYVLLRERKYVGSRIAEVCHE